MNIEKCSINFQYIVKLVNLFKWGKINYLKVPVDIDFHKISSATRSLQYSQVWASCKRVATAKQECSSPAKLQVKSKGKLSQSPGDQYCKPQLPDRLKALQLLSLKPFWWAVLAPTLPKLGLSHTTRVWYSTDNSWNLKMEVSLEEVSDSTIMMIIQFSGSNDSKQLNCAEVQLANCTFCNARRPSASFLPAQHDLIHVVISYQISKSWLSIFLTTYETSKKNSKNILKHTHTIGIIRILVHYFQEQSGWLRLQ